MATSNKQQAHQASKNTTILVNWRQNTQNSPVTK